MPAHTPEDTHALLEAAFNAGDLDAFVDVFEPDAAMVTPVDGSVVRGHAGIRHALEPIFALEPKAGIDVVKKVEIDGLALTHARWSLTGTGPDGEPVELAGHGSIVSRRQLDGSWLIVLDNPASPH
jgi:uncharacterized protein (TIGR02246 family)